MAVEQKIEQAREKYTFPSKNAQKAGRISSYISLFVKLR